jgi:hypothetical protein
MVLRIVKGPLAAALLSSCITPGDIVRQRAALERQCPEASIRIVELPGSAYRADGCGRSETFVCVVERGSTQACTKESGGANLTDAGVHAAP